MSPGAEKNLLINLNYFGPNRWIRIQAFVFPEAESVLPLEPALGKESDILLHRYAFLIDDDGLMIGVKQKEPLLR